MIPSNHSIIMNKTKTRKIGAIALVVLGILIFVAYSIHLILFKLSLPPYSVQTEGKYVAYGLEVWGFLWSIPVVVSLFLLAYLIYPSKFERSSTMANVLFMLLAIGGFGITAVLVALAIINNFPSTDYILMFILGLIIMTSPFWIVGILALSAFKKERFEKMKREHKPIYESK
ncbi:MAG: hypothetical protein MSIBF_02415 [Candidatus Altiarchaeales archaeon IMC4]|nr:MAG: hypothetical protein MSIBF_02415 [Candidatus Altiarchaeales archaeon IMC4]